MLDRHAAHCNDQNTVCGCSPIVGCHLYNIWQHSKQSSCPAETPSPTPTNTQTASPHPTQTPLETVVFQAISVDSDHVISVQVHSTSDQNVTLTQATIKDESGNTLAIDNTLNSTLPASGSNTKITLQVDTVNFTSGGPYTLTLISQYDNSFTSQKFMLRHKCTEAI